MDSSNTMDSRPASVTDGRERWEPMQLAYVGHVADLMRGSSGSRRDTGATNCRTRQPLIGSLCGST